jgi:hypothetical protein
MARSVMMEVMEQEAVQVMNRFRKVLVLRHKQHNPQIMPKRRRDRAQQKWELMTAASAQRDRCR